MQLVSQSFRILAILGTVAVSALGCAAQADAPADPADPAEENLGVVQSADSTCPTGDAPNRTFSLLDPGDSALTAQSESYFNPGGPCGPNARRLMIVDFNVNAYRVNDTYKFDVNPSGSYNWAECLGLTIYARLQLWNPGTQQWQTVDYQHGNEDNPDADYHPWLRGRMDGSPFSCSMPYATFYRQNFLLPGSTLQGTPKFRIRAYITKSDGSYAGVRVRGANIGDW